MLVLVVTTLSCIALAFLENFLWWLMLGRSTADASWSFTKNRNVEMARTICGHLSWTLSLACVLNFIYIRRWFYHSIGIRILDFVICGALVVWTFICDIQAWNISVIWLMLLSCGHSKHVSGRLRFVFCFEASISAGVSLSNFMIGPLSVSPLRFNHYKL